MGIGNISYEKIVEKQDQKLIWQVCVEDFWQASLLTINKNYATLKLIRYYINVNEGVRVRISCFS